MKFVIAFLFMLVPAIALGSPFLTCDPYPAETEITKFVIDIDGVAVDSDPHINEDGTIIIRHDLSDLAVGSHVVKAKAINKWGESEWSAVYSFTKSIPGAPLNLNIINNGTINITIE